jgi:GT2 family glycosyltransferase
VTQTDPDRTVSVVIPTYGGSAHLATTLRSVGASHAAALEVLVVDDGSSPPIAELVNCHAQALPVPVRTIRQENAGPAGARNRGFRETRGRVVLFLDDDIEAPPDLIARHLDAHQRWPNSVIWGRCMLPPAPSVLRETLDDLGGDRSDTTHEFLHVSHVASGQLSVQRSTFVQRGGVYAETLRTPAAEEYELTLRLRRQGIAAIFAPRIVALHHQPIEITSVCRHQYTHGFGCAEAALRCPDTLELTDLRRIIERASAPLTTRQGLTMRVASSARARLSLLAAAKILERVAPSSFRLKRIYRVVIAVHFVGGVRDGLRHFRRRPPGC